jgi:hypothetical protein
MPNKMEWKGRIKKKDHKIQNAREELECCGKVAASTKKRCSRCVSQRRQVEDFENEMKERSRRKGKKGIGMNQEVFLFQSPFSDVFSRGT